MKKSLNHSQAELNHNLVEAGQVGDLALVRQLLTSPDLKIHADIHTQSDLTLRLACCNGYLNVVQYLLSSPELKEHADIHAHDNDALIFACVKGHLDIVRYLLTLPQLSEHANVHAMNDSSLIVAIEQDRHEVVQFLLYDMNMQVSPDTYEHLSRQEKKDELARCVAKRDLFFDLNAHMSEKNIVYPSKGPKI